MKDMTSAYQAAEALMPWNTEHAVLNGAPEITWIDGDSFFYGRQYRKGEEVLTEFVRVSCTDGHEAPLFDHHEVALALGCEDIPFSSCRFDEKKLCLTFFYQGKEYDYHIDDRTLTDKGYPNAFGSSISPDQTKEVFSRDHDLYLRDRSTNKVTRLTYDGEKDFEYGASAEYSGAVGIRLSGKKEAPGVLWSPDSAYFLTYKLDQRNVPELFVIQSYDDAHVSSIRPRLHTYKCSFPEDKCVPLAYYYLCRTEDGSMLPLDLPPQIAGAPILHPEYAVAKWAKDSSFVYTTYVSRGNKSGAFFLIHTDGHVQKIMEESREDFLNLDTFGELDGFGSYRFSNYLTEDKKALFWQSERDNYARLFRYRAEDGFCEGPVTPPDYIVGKLIAADDEGEWLYFMASNLPSVSDPYYQLLCRVHYDGSDFTVLTPEDGMHEVTVNGDYLVDTWSRVDLPPVTVLRKTDGTWIRDVVQSDIRELLSRGYIMPERFQVLASDGSTPLYGILIRPADFDPEKTYPFIDYIYGGMQCYNVPKAFTWKGAIKGREMMGGLEEFAQLGFAGIILDGLGTPGRGKALHNISYENIHGCAGLKDHVTSLPQLKEKFPFLDLDRAGMWGNSGGGCATSRAMLEYPGVYKVGVSSAGNHDQRMYNNLWTENYYGLYNEEIYRKGDNTALAKNLQGKLFIVHGAMDDNVAMSQSIRLVDALIREDKDFDFLILPRTDHNVPANPYFIRKKLDYFVRHLLGEEPPREYHFRLPEREE